MRLIRSMFTALLVAVLFASLTACGGEPIALETVPVFPEAAPLAEGENTMADAIAGSLKETLAERGTVELQLYSVPASVEWTAVDSFYSESLADSDWKVADELRQENSALTTTGWSRGSFASEQGLMVGYGPDSLGEGAFLIVALFSE